MPIYVYQCADCDTQVEKRQGFSDAPLTTCESCGGSVRRVLQPVGIIFKGSGFYVTDSRSGSNGKKDSANGEPKSETKTDGASTAAGESKGEAKSETKSDSKSESKSDGAAKSSESKSGSGTSTSSSTVGAAS